jgi:hypothetical protein
MAVERPFDAPELLFPALTAVLERVSTPQQQHVGQLARKFWDTPQRFPLTLPESVAAETALPARVSFGILGYDVNGVALLMHPRNPLKRAQFGFFFQRNAPLGVVNLAWQSPTAEDTIKARYGPTLRPPIEHPGEVALGPNEVAYYRSLGSTSLAPGAQPLPGNMVDELIESLARQYY